MEDVEDDETTPHKKKRQKQDAAAPAAAEEDDDAFKTPAPTKRSGASLRVCRLLLSRHFAEIMSSSRV